MSAQVRDWPSERPPRPLAARPVKFPPYEVRTFGNGMRVVAVLHHEQPAVSLRLIVRAGGAQDPKGKTGVASLAAALLDQGTTTKSAQQIADTIDTIGGGLGAGAGTDLTFVSVVVMKDSFDMAMQLMSDVVRNPAFAKEEIDRQRQQLLSSLRVSYEDPDYIAGVVFDRLVYGFHPYGLPDSGTPDSIARITRDDLVAFHTAHFVPNNAILAVVGDVSTEEAFTVAEKAFGNWPRKETASAGLGAPPEPTRRVIIVDKPGAVQTEIRVGHIGVPRKHPEYMALNLATKVLGGEGSNRLHRLLRSERGLTYGASADMNTLKFGGDFVAETDTRSEATGEALRLIVDEFSRMQREVVGDRELADAKAYLAGSFPLTIETPDAIALQVLNVLFYDLDLAELETFRERVNAVTVDDVQRVARAYYKPDRLAIVLVGDASAFVGQLRGVGIAQVEHVPLAELDLTAVDLRRAAGRSPGPAAARDKPPPAAASTSQRAQQILARIVETKGGADKLRSLKSVRATATTKLMSPQGPINAETTTYVAYPGKFRVEANLPGGTIIQTYVDGDAWIQSPTGVQEAPETMREEFRASVARDVIPLLLRASAGNARVQVLPERQEGGTTLAGIEISASDLDAIGLYVDEATGLVVVQTYKAAGPGGLEAAEEVFSDYRIVDGVQVAFKALVRRRGTVMIERTVHTLQLNAPIDPSLFKKPS